MDLKSEEWVDMPEYFDHEQREKRKAAIRKLKRKRLWSIPIAAVVALVVGVVVGNIEQVIPVKIDFLMTGLFILAAVFFIRWLRNISKRINELKKKLPSEFE